MAEELNQFIGWPSGQYAMVTTSGGSLANLTALLAARNDKLPDVWSDGLAVAAYPRPAVAVSEHTHYSVCRAIGILGIGEQQIVRLPTNRAGQIAVEQVAPTLAAAERRGLKVFCLVASAGTTSLGAFDSIGALADIAADKDIWVHVDGAHGASLLVSPELRHKLNGIERADSFAWDAHKMMFVPAVCTMLFYKNREKAFGAFRQEASYVFDAKADIYREYSAAEMNFECTKRPMIMNLWILWSLYGREPFAEKIEYLCGLAAEAHSILAQETDFEALHRPEANIFCFRHRPPGLPVSQLGEFQRALWRRIRDQGMFFISKVDIDDVAALRVVFMNHEIEAAHFRQLLREIRRHGHCIIDEWRLTASPVNAREAV